MSTAPRTFLEIMREVYRSKRAGVSSAVSLMANIGPDEEWDLVVKRLLAQAKLESSLKRFKPGSRPKRTPAVSK